MNGTPQPVVDADIIGTPDETGIRRNSDKRFLTLRDVLAEYTRSEPPPFFTVIDALPSRPT